MHGWKIWCLMISLNPVTEYISRIVSLADPYSRFFCARDFAVAAVLAIDSDVMLP